MNKNVQPICYVLGLESQIGLALVRELGRSGVPVIGIAQSQHAIALHSRYLLNAVVLSNLRSDKGIRELYELGEAYGTGILLAISEANTSWLIEHRNKFG